MRTYFVFLLVLSSVLAVGCGGPPVRTGDPNLPPGFGAVIPNTELQIYSYINQGTPFAFRPGDNPLSAEGGMAEIRVDSLAIWAGFRGEEPVIGIRADVEQSELIPFLVEAFEADNQRDDLWTLQNDDILYVVMGEGIDADAFRQTIERNDFVVLKEARPGIWNSVLALPESPPMSPIGVGYVDITDTVLNQVIRKAQEGIGDGAQALTRLRPLVERIGIRHSVFGFYGPALPPIHGSINVEDLKSQPFAGLIVLDSNIPAFVLSFIFDIVLGGAELEVVDMDGEKAYAPPINDVAALIKNDGSTILLSVGTTRDTARDLLATVDAS